MTKMVNDSDVEDVLFSIRRLVSDTPEAKPDAAPEPDSNGKSDALFLTSSLRVSDPATEPEQIDLEDMTTDLSHFRDAIGREKAEVAELPSLDEVFSDRPSDEAPRRLHLSEVVSDAVPAAANDEYFEDEDTGDLDARKWTEHPDTETLGEFATPGDTFGAPELETEDQADTKETPVEDSTETVAVAKSAEIEDAAEMDQPLVDAVGQEDDHESVETADIEAFEEHLADDAADQDGAEADAIEAEPVAADEPEPEEDQDFTAAAQGLADFDEDILDEDALRDMVSEIVRQELSGELGERITRNVRKLVRREIHRALMTREFD